MYIGIDLGTSGAKAVLVNRDGEVIRQTHERYPIHRPQTGWAEQSPLEWWLAVTRAVQAVARHHGDTVRGIGVAGQMHGVVLLSGRREVLRNAIIWMDTRSTAQTALQDHPEWWQMAYNPLSTGIGAASLVWLREHEPAILRATRTILAPKDYIAHMLTERLTSEPSDGSGLLLMDIPNGGWSEALLAHYGLSDALLPPLYDSSAVIGRLTNAAARLVGLPEGIPVVAGAADQAAMLLGSGAIAPGDATLTLGTGAQLSVVSGFPMYDRRLNTFCHAAPQRWYHMGALLAGGFALDWWHRNSGQMLDALLEDAAQAPPGAGGVLFLPYLNGERTPHMNPNLRASFVNLHAAHESSSLTRAVLEGVAFALRDALGALHEIGAEPAELILGGGGSRSALWREIIASVLNLPLIHAPYTEPTALGAALLAAVGTGQFVDVDDGATQWVRYTTRTLPQPDWVVTYARIYAEDWPRWRPSLANG
ncbi:MAG: xylulokinase [Anaerolineales bacterium]